MGGFVQVDETEAYPFLDAELLFLGRAVHAGLPVLGIWPGCRRCGGRTWDLWDDRDLGDWDFRDRVPATPSVGGSNRTGFVPFASS